MSSNAAQLSDDSHVVFLRVGNPYYRGLCDTYHQLKLALGRVERRSDLASLRKARELNRARRVLLEAILES